MATQLVFDFSSRASFDNHSLITKNTRIDVSEIARGVGFVEVVQVSLALHDALQHERDDYDQLLYDALWLAHFKLSLDGLTFATFNFTTALKGPGSETAMSIHLRLRVQSREQTVCLGLLEDF
jgi:hypothetical protein